MIVRDQTDIHDQLQALALMLASLPEKSEARVADFGAAMVSPCAVVGEIMSCSVMGGYFVTTDSALRAEAQRRIAQARLMSEPLVDYLARSSLTS